MCELSLSLSLSLSSSLSISAVKGARVSDPGMCLFDICTATNTSTLYPMASAMQRALSLSLSLSCYDINGSTIAPFCQQCMVTELRTIFIVYSCLCPYLAHSQAKQRWYNPTVETVTIYFSAAGTFFFFTQTLS